MQLTFPRVGYVGTFTSKRVRPAGRTKKKPRRRRRCKKTCLWGESEEVVFQIDIEVPQQWVRNKRVVPRRKVVLRCIGVGRALVEQILDSKQHGQFLDGLDAYVTIHERITADMPLVAVAIGEFIDVGRVEAIAQSPPTSSQGSSSRPSRCAATERRIDTDDLLIAHQVQERAAGVLLL